MPNGGKNRYIPRKEGASSRSNARAVPESERALNGTSRFDVMAPFHAKSRGAEIGRKNRNRKERDWRWKPVTRRKRSVGYENAVAGSRWRFNEFLTRPRIPSTDFSVISGDISVVGVLLFRRMCDRSRTHESASGVVAAGQW